MKFKVLSPIAGYNFFSAFWQSLNTITSSSNASSSSFVCIALLPWICSSFCYFKYDYVVIPLKHFFCNQTIKVILYSFLCIHFTILSFTNSTYIVSLEQRGYTIAYLAFQRQLRPIKLRPFGIVLGHDNTQRSPLFTVIIIPTSST